MTDTLSTPSVGRVVHFRSDKEEAGACQAAVVAKVHTADQVNLAVFDSWGRSSPRTYVRLDTEQARAHGWHWPEHV